MPSDISFLEFSESEEQPQQDRSAAVYEHYLVTIANRKMRSYKQIVHDRGKKQGQSYYRHVMDLAAIAEKLRSALRLDENEMCCVLLALTIHDMNKIPPYNKNASGWEQKYANAATLDNITRELERLDADTFFPAWRTYIHDITLLAHFHQEAATGTVFALDQRKITVCTLSPARLKGPLKFLMKAADTADNSHSGDHCNRTEAHIRDKLLQHINAAMPERQYRFFGHRLAELRGLFTNVLHNELVRYFQERSGKNACIDLLYYPEGVNYLLDRDIPLVWDDDSLQEVATRVQQRLAAIQLEDIEQFIKARPAGIVVDDAAIASGASNAQIFEVIANMVARKQYKADWCEERNKAARSDLEQAALHSKNSNELKTQAQRILQQQSRLIPFNEAVLRRGEFVSAYRKFLEDHRTAQLKELRSDAWTRVYRLFTLPEEKYAIYGKIDPFRRGYFLGSDLPSLDIDTMMDMALTDLALLEQQANEKKGTTQGKKSIKRRIEDSLIDTPYILDYLRRNLEIWENPLEQPMLSKPMLTTDFKDSLRRYADVRRLHGQCCYCSSPLKAGEWMSAQVPPSIGVQSFSNRLEAGSLQDPKRNVCDTCRMQFILEKLAWRSHRDKQGSEQLTLYLHLFPLSFFTQPELRAWWLSIEHLRDSDHRAFLIDTKKYFRNWEATRGETAVQGYRTGVNGLGLPMLSETLSTTPVLPIVAPGDNYGLQFQLALEEAVVLASWFECRVLLSRSPVPLLNLSHEYIDDRPVVMLIDGMPRNLSWLLPTTSLDAEGLRVLRQKLSMLHLLAEKLYYKGGDFDAIPHELATTAADDSLALFYQVDRLIEKKVANEKATVTLSPEQHAHLLRCQLTPIVDTLMNIS